ncbi:MAG: twin-arginine translocase TatA/TatE family subunit [Pseudomonadota bacterium]
MALGPWQIAIILVLALLLFGGGGKVSTLMGDFAKGIKAFRKGLQDDEKSLEDKANAARDVTPPSETGDKATVDTDTQRSA